MKIDMKRAIEVLAACGYECEEIEQLRRELEEAKRYPPNELTWLFSHCRAIGMDCKSDSGKWEHDIALFTINQKDQLAAQALVIEKLRAALENYKILAQDVDSPYHYKDAMKALTTPDYTKLLAERDAKYILAIEKLRKALEYVHGLALGKEVRDFPTMMCVARDALAATPDYRKELAERDAALLEQVADQWGGEQRVSNWLKQLATNIRTGENIG